MPSPYVKKVRPLKMSQLYSKEKMNEAIQACRDGLMSVRAAAKHFEVPKSTLQDRVQGAHSEVHGRPPVLTPDEEAYLVEMINQCSEWGFPLTQLDLQMFVKTYLDKKGATTIFKENLPTHRFVATFLGRHPELRLRKTNLIKRSRASVSVADIEEFFKNYEKCAAGIPPENIFNYDESNLRDDPGSKKCIFKKGTKYCEKVMNSSKQAISVMFSGSAAGEFLPPMVVYKAANVYESWRERGPKGAVYSCSKSGWFDAFQFEKWFFEVALPKLKRKVGRKLLVGDNLSSHISSAVIQACLDNDIQFLCFPPNATHLIQPLDVGVFAPVKKAWRIVLTEYKMKHPKASCKISKSLLNLFL